MLRSLTRIGSTLLCVALPAAAGAQDGYRQPPAPIAQILDAERTPVVNVSPDRTTLLLLERVEMPTIAERRVALPAGARVGNVAWSDDGRSIAFTLASDTGLTLWLAEVGSASARELAPVRLNGAMGAPCSWIDTAQLICRTVPADRGEVPTGVPVPRGPVIQQSMGRAAPNRTYQDLLQNAADEARLDYLSRTQLAVITTGGAVTPVGPPGTYGSAVPSPDGKYIAVTAIQRPYSYIVPLSGFPATLSIWDLSGSVVRTLAELPLRDDVGTSFDAVPRRARNLQWRSDAPATAVWVEALDDGDPTRPAEKRDRIHMLPAPFAGEPSVLLDVVTRAAAVRWVRSDLALVEEEWWKTRRTKTWAVNPGDRSAPARLLFDRSSEDRYGNPGSFVTIVGGPFGERVVLTSADGRFAYLLGTGASPEGDRPFLDRMELSTGETERLWRSAAPYYEQVVAILDDGVQLSAKLYLPPGYTRAQGPLLFLFWAYPEEFRSAAAAAQVVGSPYRFVRPAGASHLFLLTQGYGILDGPTMPIVGEGEREPNDSYLEQLVSSAKAAVDEVVRLGVGDRSRIAVGGHSSGAMSPFYHADRINEPLLLIHGEADNDSGTFPIQSERMYAALMGNRGTVRYVVLPAESHCYAARESVGHTLWEMVSWLDTHVKNAPRAGAGTSPE